MAEKLTIKIDGDPKQYEDALKSVEANTRSVGNSLVKVTKIAAAGFVALGAGAAGAVNEARKFETIRTQFEVLTGSVAQASKTMKELQDFSASTPFQFESIAKASQQLLGFGFQADQLQGKLNVLGDVAAASGQPINDLSLIFGQVAAAGKLTGERLQQLQERAIPIGPALAKSLGVAETSIRQLVSEGRVSFNDFEKAFASLNQKGGFAFEGMVKQSKTLDGVLSTVKDNISLFAADIGEQLLPVIKELGIQFIGFIQNLRKSDSLINVVKGTISVTSKIILGIAEAFETLGTRIGAILGTISEVITQALNLNFKQAVDAFKTNQKAFTEDALKIQQDYAAKTKAIDDGLYKEKDAAQVAAQEKELANIKSQQEKKAALDQAEKDRKAAEFEVALADLNNTEIVKTEEELARIQERIDAKNAQDEITKIQELERQGKHDEALLAAEQLKNERIIEFNKKRLEREKQIQALNLQAASNFVSAGATLAQEGSETQKNLQAVNAIISTYTAATQALASPPGPPFTIPLSASIAALGFANVAKIKGAKFAEGGVFKGGIPGVDSIPAVVQRNEIIAPTSSFDEVVEGTARQRGFVRPEEASSTGNTITILLEPVGEFVNFFERKIIEARVQNTGIL